MCTTNLEDIDEALKNGAYGVIHSLEHAKPDEESAFIKVRSIKSSMFRILRYELLRKNLKLYRATNIICALVTNLADGSSFVLPDSIDLAFEVLINSKENQIFIGENRELLQSISLDFEELTPSENLVFNVISKTMFHTTIFFEGVIYDALPIPPIFLKELSLCLDFMERHCIYFDLYKFEYISNFKPHFINKNLESKKFGQSDMVLICENDLDEFEKYLTYIKKNAKWGKSIFAMPKEYEETFKSLSNIFFYSNLSELQKILKTNIFNFALVFGAKESDIFNLLKSKKGKQGVFSSLE